MNGHRFTAVAALVCDDVRNEISGREILIGVFADNVHVAVLPANLIVSLYMRVLFARSGLSNIKFRVLAPAGIQVTPEASIALPGPPDLEAVASIVIRGINFQAQAEGRYEFQWQPPEQEWETVTSFRIKKGDMPPLSITQTPASIAGRPQPEQSPSAVAASSSPP
jgi:hypothetical protein